MAVSIAGAAPGRASEVCAAGNVGSTPLPGCSNCPPGIYAGPSGVHPHVLVFVCVRP